MNKSEACPDWETKVTSCLRLSTRDCVLKSKNSETYCWGATL